MNESSILPKFTIDSIEKAISEGKSVHPDMIAAFEKQTGKVVRETLIQANPSGNLEPTQGGSDSESLVPFPNPRKYQKRTFSFNQQSLDGSSYSDHPRGFLKLMRSAITAQLEGDMRAQHLLFVIGRRARWSRTPSLDGLQYGQAYVGDFRSIDMSEKEYRCAKTRLQKWGLVSFEGTSRGTIATLLDDRVFSLSDDRKNEKWGGQEGGREGDQISEEKLLFGADSTATISRTKGGQGATNQKGKKGKKGKKGGGTPSRSSSRSWPETLPEHMLLPVAKSLGTAVEKVAARYEAFSSRKQGHRDPAPPSIEGVLQAFWHEIDPEGQRQAVSPSPFPLG